MKPEKKLIKDLTDQVGPHSIRLKFIEKSNMHISPKSKGLNYLRIVFQDEEIFAENQSWNIVLARGKKCWAVWGGKIKTTLYDDEIGVYKNVIHDKMEYEICNAKIKLLPEKYRGTAADHPYQLSFGAKTIIRPIEGCKPPIGPKCISLAAIPKNIANDNRYDVLAILIYVEPLRQVPRSTRGTLAVRELVVMDPSTGQPLIITAWAEIVSREGFSVATTSATFVKFNHEGEKADMLRAWANENRGTISTKQQQVTGTRERGGQRVLTMIKALRAKKVTTTLQDE